MARAQVDFVYDIFDKKSCLMLLFILNEKKMKNLVAIVSDLTEAPHLYLFYTTT